MEPAQETSQASAICRAKLMAFRPSFKYTTPQMGQITLAFTKIVINPWRRMGICITGAAPVKNMAPAKNASNLSLRCVTGACLEWRARSNMFAYSVLNPSSTSRNYSPTCACTIMQNVTFAQYVNDTFRGATLSASISERTRVQCRITLPSATLTASKRELSAGMGSSSSAAYATRRLKIMLR